MVMFKVSNSDEELVSAFEDAVERIESLATEQPDKKNQFEGKVSEKKDRHTDQNIELSFNGAQDLGSEINSAAFASDEVDEIKGIFEDYIESQYEHVATESQIDGGSNASRLPDESAFNNTDERMDKDLPQTELVSETFSDGELVAQPENYHFSDEQTDVILSADQPDPFFDEDVIANDTNNTEMLDDKGEGNSSKIPEFQGQTGDVELFDDSVINRVKIEDVELEDGYANGVGEGEEPDGLDSNNEETSKGGVDSNIFDEGANVSFMDDPSVSVMAEMNNVSNKNSVANRSENKSPPRTLVIVGFVISIIALFGIGLLNYRLQSQFEKLNSTIVSMEGQLKGLKNAQGLDVDPIALSTRTNKRIDELVAQVNKLNGALVHLNVRGDDGATQKNDESSPVELSALYGMISSLEQEFQQFKVEKGAMGVTKVQASASPKVLEPAINKKRLWSVKLMSVRRESLANRLMSEFQAKGIPAEKQVVTVGGRAMYRLGVDGFASKNKATEYGIEAIEVLGLDSYWIAR